jgi:hypothetical protein
MSNALVHKFVSAKTDGTDTTLVRPSNWNEEHVFAGGATGSLLVFDATASDKAAWISAVATGQVLKSAGVGTVPAWGTINVAFLSDGTNVALLNAANAFTNDNSLAATKKLYFDGGSNTYLYEEAADTISIVTGGTRRFQISTTSVTFESPVVLAANGFGTHLFSAGGAGGNIVGVRNTTAGAGNYSQLSVGNDGSASALTMRATTSTYTASGQYPQNGGVINVDRAGGLSIAAEDAAGSIRFYAGGTGEDVRIHASGGVSIGDTTDPGSTNLRVAGTSTLVGNVRMGGTNITDSVGTPTCGTNCTVIAGKDYAFTTNDAAAGTTITVNFGNTWSTAPICVGTTSVAAQGIRIVSVSTTSVVYERTGAGGAGTAYMLCRSY